jgi:alkyl hydroperoxide reductase subunit AhpF
VIFVRSSFANQSFSGPTNLSSLSAKLKGGSKKPLIDPAVNKRHYDVAVIGGGSGGIAFCYVSYSDSKKYTYTMIKMIKSIL